MASPTHRGHIQIRLGHDALHAGPGAPRCLRPGGRHDRTSETVEHHRENRSTVGDFGNVKTNVVKPEIGIALEAGVTRDAPKVGPEEAQEVLGAGPVIFLYDSSELPNRKMVALVKQVARDKNIPLQTDVIQGYGDDSAEIQKSNGGVPTVNMLAPVRYTHAHNGIMNRADFDRLVDLLVALLQSLDANQVRNLRDFTP